MLIEDRLNLILVNLLKRVFELFRIPRNWTVCHWLNRIVSSLIEQNITFSHQEKRSRQNCLQNCPTTDNVIKNTASVSSKHLVWKRRSNMRYCNCFNNLLQYSRERDRMLSAYFVCSGFVYMVVVVAIAITLAG